MLWYPIIPLIVLRNVWICSKHKNNRILENNQYKWTTSRLMKYMYSCLSQRVMLTAHISLNLVAAGCIHILQDFSLTLGNCMIVIVPVNTLRPWQNGRHFADNIIKCIFVNENVWISIRISLEFVPTGPINHIPALVQILAWCRPGNKPLSEPMMISLPMHIYAPLGLNELIKPEEHAFTILKSNENWRYNSNKTKPWACSVGWLYTVYSFDCSEIKARISYYIIINSSPSVQNGRHSTDNLFNRIFVNEKFCILIDISLKFVPKGLINNNPALF